MSQSRHLPPARTPIARHAVVWAVAALGAGCLKPPTVALTGDGAVRGDGAPGDVGGPAGTGGSGLAGGSGGTTGSGGRSGGGTGGGIVPGTGGSILPGTGGGIVSGTGGGIVPGTGGGIATGTGGAGVAPTSCPATSSRAALCTQIPRFTATSYVLDGVGTEFCNIPPMEFAATSLSWINPAHATSRPAMVSLRVGWSADAFWAHVHVKDAAVYVDSAATLWNGDNVQLFFSGTSLLTGTYSGTEDGGAMHVIVAPPANGILARAITLYETGFGLITMGTLPASYYAARQVTDGYEVELRLPWSASASPRASGASIGFDFMIGVSDMGTGVELEAAMSNKTVSSSASCYNVVHPGCDDRTWCLPTLQ